MIGELPKIAEFQEKSEICSRSESFLDHIPKEMMAVILSKMPVGSKYIFSLTCKSNRHVFFDEVKSAINDLKDPKCDGGDVDEKSQKYSYQSSVTNMYLSVQYPDIFRKAINETNSVASRSNKWAVRKVLLDTGPEHWMAFQKTNTKTADGMLKKRVYKANLQYLFAMDGSTSLLEELFGYGHNPDGSSFLYALFSKNFSNIRWYLKKGFFPSASHVICCLYTYDACELKMLFTLLSRYLHASFVWDVESIIICMTRGMHELTKWLLCEQFKNITVQRNFGTIVRKKKAFKHHILPIDPSDRSNHQILKNFLEFFERDFKKSDWYFNVVEIAIEHENQNLAHALTSLGYGKIKTFSALAFAINCQLWELSCTYLLVNVIFLKSCQLWTGPQTEHFDSRYHVEESVLDRLCRTNVVRFIDGIIADCSFVGDKIKPKRFFKQEYQ